MKVSVIKNKNIQNIILPNNIEGSYWITDKEINGITKNLISIEAKDKSWYLVSNKEASVNNNGVPATSIKLDINKFYEIKKSSTDASIFLYCSDTVTPYNEYAISEYLDKCITIGSDDKDLIKYSAITPSAATIKKENDQIYIYDNDFKQGIYVNNIRIKEKQKLAFGDIIFIQGLKIIFLGREIQNNGAHSYISISVIDGVSVKLMTTSVAFNSNQDFIENTDEIEFALYKEEDYFHRTPRFISKSTSLTLEIDPPPGAPNNDSSRPAILTMGPMVTMSMSSMLTGYTAVSNVLNGGSSWKSALPSLVMCGAMLGSVFIFPLLTKQYEAIENSRYNKKRKELYTAYIESNKEKILNTLVEQSHVLMNNYPSTKNCEEVIVNKYSNIWQRRLFDKDFLEVNLGLGSYPMKMDIKFPQEHFTMDKDDLREIAQKLNTEPKLLKDVPVVYSVLGEGTTGIIGEMQSVAEYTKKLLTQILAFHGYDNLKIVILTNEENESTWKVFKSLPHIFSDNREVRFFATNTDEYKEVCYYLEKKYNDKYEKFGDKPFALDNLEETYLIITDSYKNIKSFSAIEKIINSKVNYGFATLILDNQITNLPDHCNDFIIVNKEKGELCKDSDFENKIEFKVENCEIDYEKCVKQLANLPIEFTDKEEGKLPSKIGFLEMFDVGKIEQLNAQYRWKNSNPMLTLQSPIGVGKNGEKINVDLHEKYHGPHGLIAGMTGSGKSELIISYILSMAINYHPYEVQFILIDYKGGGLAGAFENKNTGLKLPHLVGTITNLDTNEIKRSLASINSELKRRQTLFNKARELSNESTIDIYKYQKMYREGQVSEPVSHLFIICDEFAELKSQQPDFMDELNSTARIGRSLGVHLILATQKPNGVVDAQIWSNTRFRICLRVQDKADSNEVIKCPDAALLKNVGRFYFQVGYNEVFLLGQAAYAGGKYIPSENVNRELNTSIDIVNNIGYITKKIETKVKKATSTVSLGEELINIVKYLDDVAYEQGIECKPLWLEKIMADIRVDNLIKKYNYQKTPNTIDLIIGEYDVPTKQEQRLLTIPLTKNGNALVYGAAGSGKENLLTTMLYSSMLFYNSTELNHYIIDMGSGALRMFEASPLVGDIVTGDNEEKLRNLYRLLASTIENRKKLFADYGGDYISYTKATGNTIPVIIITINNFETYQETYGNYEETLNILTRDSAKYGIYFVITVNTPNGMRFRTRQNFATIYSLQQNSPDDYVSILGNIHRNYPAKIFGRGIIKADEVYEFQTAYVTERNNINSYIKDLCTKYAKTMPKAPRIPVLPNTVTFQDIQAEFGHTDELIIGIDKETLNITKYNYKKKIANLIIGQDITNTEKFIAPMINQLIALNTSNLIVINAENIVLEDKYKKLYQYRDSNFNGVFESLYNYLSKQVEDYNTNGGKLNIKPITCIIIGLETFKNKLSTSNRSLLGDIFTMPKETNLINYIIVDSITALKQYEFEMWYKTTVDNTSALWIGPGFNTQFSIKLSKKTDDVKNDIGSNFCFVVERGIPTCVKYIESLELDIS